MAKTEKKKANTDWKAIERIVYALEKFITPGYKVEHNIRLPVTGKSKGRRRQVDVLITVTNGRKRTRYIVEVQKRNSKVNINTFHGWVKKMKSIDCQHLICVSTKGFPKTLIEDVKTEYGTDTVILMTLNDFDTLVDPETQVNIDLDVESFRWALTNKHWDIVDFGMPEIESPKQPAGTQMNVEFNGKQEMFMLGDQKYTVPAFVEMIVNVETDSPQAREILLTGTPINLKIHIKEENGVYALLGEEKRKILIWDFVLKVKATPIKFNAESRKLAYRQAIEDSTLAWICSTVFTYDQDVVKEDNSIITETHSIQIDFICKLVDGKMQWRIHEHGIRKMP